MGTLSEPVQEADPAEIAGRLGISYDEEQNS